MSERAGGLDEAWERAASEWALWARSRELDHPFWELNLPAFLELVPPPGRLTLDVACGEGRLARELAGLGHKVVGVDSSPSLAAAARASEPGFEVHVADAAAMPLSDGAVDLAVAMMALMAIDELDAVVREVARVLEPGGRFCIALLHPIETWTDAEVESYFETTSYEKRVTREPDLVSMCFHDVHRPMEAYFAALSDAGFLVEQVREPRPSKAYRQRFPEVAGWGNRPFLLHLRAVLAPSGPTAERPR